MPDRRRSFVALACALLFAAAACEGSGEHNVPEQEIDPAERETAAPVNGMDSLASGEDIADPAAGPINAAGSPAPPPSGSNPESLPGQTETGAPGAPETVTPDTEMVNPGARTP